MVKDILYPNDDAPNSEKRSLEFGLKVCRMINEQWGGELSDYRNKVDKLRRYARGEQCTKKYKDAIEGKKTIAGVIRTHKIDYSEPLKIFPTYIDILTNAIDESLFKPRAEAIDETSVAQKKKHINKLEKDFYTQDLSKEFSNVIGMDITPPNLPQDEEELQARKTEYKPAIELAEELFIESVFKENKFDTIKSPINKDIATIGVGVGMHVLDRRYGIQLKYVDPKNWITNRFEYEDGRDIRYHALTNQVSTIGELEALAGRKFTQEELDKLKKLSKKYTDYIPDDTSEVYNADADAHRLIEYWYVAYKTKENRQFKKLRKNRRLKLIDRTEDGYYPNNPNKKIELDYEVWYEGIYIPDIDFLAKWERIPNQAKLSYNKVFSPFVVYAPNVKKKTEKGFWRFDSITERAIPIIDDLNRDWFKMQQLKMELRPNTVRISPTALKNVVLNAGDKPLDPNLLMNLFFGRGILLADEYNEDGERIGEPIKEFGGGVQNNAIMLLSQEFANNYNRLRQLIGVNPLRDGTTTPNSKTAVTVQKLLLASSNNATNHIVKASFNISVQFAEATSSHLRDVMTVPDLKRKYYNILGRENTELLDAVKNNPMASYAIYFDFEPDNDQRVAFEQSLINDYSRGLINSAQYNKIRNMRNVKNAIKYLEYIIKQNEKKEQELKERNIQLQAQANQQASVVAEQAKQQTKTIEFETEKQLLLYKAQLEAEEEKRKAYLDELKAQADFERKRALKQMELEIIYGKEKFKQDRMDDRVKLEGTIQSKHIEQRKTDGMAIDFEKQLNNIFKNPLRIVKDL